MSAKPFKTPSSFFHFLHGLIAGLLSFSYFYISVFMYIQFLLYEWVEESKLHDEMYCELLEWSVGYTTGLLAYITIHMI